MDIIVGHKLTNDLVDSKTVGNKLKTIRKVLERLGKDQNIDRRTK